MADARVYLYSLIGTAYALVMGVLTSVLVNRFLGPQDRGEFASLAFVSTTSQTIVSMLVSSQALIWSMNRGPQSRTGAALAISGLQAILSAPVALAVMLMFHTSAVTSLVVAFSVAMLVAVLQTAYNGLAAIHRAQANFKLVAFTVIVVPTGYALSLGAFIAADSLTPATAMVSSGIPLVICVALFGWVVLREAGNWGVRWDDVLACIRHGLAFLPVTALAVLVASADRALILRLSNLEALGYYAAAAGLSSPIFLAAETIVQISYVEVSRREQVSDAKTIALARFRIGQMALLGLCGFVLLVGPWFLVTASGPLFAGAIPVLYWLIGAAAARALMTMLDVNLRALGLLSWSFGTGCLGLAILIALGLVLIPQSGAVGAAQAVCVSCVGMLVFEIVIWRWRIGAAWSEFWGLNPATLRAVLRIPLTRSGADCG